MEAIDLITFVLSLFALVILFGRRIRKERRALNEEEENRESEEDWREEIEPPPQPIMPLRKETRPLPQKPSLSPIKAFKPPHTPFEPNVEKGKALPPPKPSRASLMLPSRSTLRRAILLREILNPPKGLL